MSSTWLEKLKCLGVSVLGLVAVVAFGVISFMLLTVGARAPSRQILFLFPIGAFVFAMDVLISVLRPTLTTSAVVCALVLALFLLIFHGR